jgi:DDE superfamily endonuclease
MEFDRILCIDVVCWGHLGLPPQGSRPCATPHRWFYVHGAVAPATGERVFLERPFLNADMFQLLVDASAQACPDRLTSLLSDTSGAHTAQRLRWPDSVWAVWLPPYCPGLHPMERLWRDLKDASAWQQVVALEAQQLYVADLWQAYDAPILQALTAYTYWLEAIYALCT